ncbi:uncharacterized protein LOC142108340 [Mixophyes fleayi]|uniref:uncharacterized protein LOC142108340 n=1 Tax=Mixophyes fleayi TaxID=3061075 RepID=UPI003F4DEE0A
MRKMLEKLSIVSYADARFRTFSPVQMDELVVFFEQSGVYVKGKPSPTPARPLETHSKNTERRPSSVDVDADGEDEDQVDNKCQEIDNAPNWNVPPRKKVAEAGLYEKHSKEHPILEDFQLHLSKTLEVPNCQQEVDNVARYLLYKDIIKVDEIQVSPPAGKGLLGSQGVATPSMDQPQDLVMCSEFDSVGAALSHVPRFNGTNLMLSDWEERLRGAARLYGVREDMLADMAAISLEGDAWHTVLLCPPEQRKTLPDILKILGDIYGDPSSAMTLRRRFFTRFQQEDETILQFAIALQEVLVKLRKKDEEGLGHPDQLLRDQFITGLRNVQLQKDLWDRVRIVKEMSFHQAQTDAIALDMDESFGSTAVTSQRVHAPTQAPVQAVSFKGCIRDLTDMIRQMREEMGQLNKEIGELKNARGEESARSGSRDGPRRRPLDGPRCWQCGRLGHLARSCPEVEPRSALN